MKIFLSFGEKTESDLMRQYLYTDSDFRKHFQLSEQIASLFMRYLLYRPDWLNTWKHGGVIEELDSIHQYWQSELWCILMSEIKKLEYILPHSESLYKDLIFFCEHAKEKPDVLPKRIFIFNIVSLPPLFWLTLQALGKLIDVHIFFLNVCQDNFFEDSKNIIINDDMLPNYTKYYKKVFNTTFFTKLESKNILFNSTLFSFDDKLNNSSSFVFNSCKQGIEFNCFLSSLNHIQKKHMFIDVFDNSLLGMLQNDILCARRNIINNHNNMYSLNINKKDKRTINHDDISLSINACNTIQKEVEVLHNKLLNMMVNDKSLSSKDIIVMAPDISIYSSTIKSVFSNNSNEALSFSISDGNILNTYPILLIFFDLCKLLNSRFVIEEVLSLLEVPSISKKFDIDRKEFELLRFWAIDVGISWGLNDNTMLELQLPTTGKNTWSFGLNRILLGFSMHDMCNDWEGILPYNVSQSELISKLISFISKLNKWHDIFIQARLLEDWLLIIEPLINDFFFIDIEYEVPFSLLKHNWKRMIQDGVDVCYSELVLVGFLLENLYNILSVDQISHKFLPGVINFTNLFLISSISFKVVCLLGMNDRVYPRHPIFNSFDLIKQQIRLGDIDNRTVDLYNFLEIIISARKILYISFIGGRDNDHAKKYPSILVSNLMRYVADNFCLVGDLTLSYEDNYSKMCSHLFFAYKNMSFNTEIFQQNINSKKKYSFVNEFLPKRLITLDMISDISFVNKMYKLPIKSLLFNDLYNFYRAPIHTWFQKTLGIYLNQNYLNYSNDEPFVVNNLVKYKINNCLLNIMVNNESINHFYKKIFASGLLPYGSFGSIYWKKQLDIMAKIVKKVKKWKLLERYNIDFSLKLGPITLIGSLLNVQCNGLLRWRPGIISINDGLSLLLEHLLYCAVGGKGESVIFGTSGKWHFSNIDPELAKEYLCIFISGYYSGMSKPLLLLKYSGGSWIKDCFDKCSRTIFMEKNRQDRAIDKLILAWEGNDYIKGERYDPYIQKIIHKLNSIHINSIILASKMYFLPVYMFNK